MFDRIYHDLAPFRGVLAKDIRRFSSSFEDRVSVRNGTASITTNHLDGPGRKKMEGWLSMVKEVESFLPDLDMAINTLDANRVIAPWEDVERAVRIENSTRSLGRFGSNKTSDEELLDIPGDVEWLECDQSRFVHLGRAACAPAPRWRFTFESKGRPSETARKQSYHGYVQNLTLARDLCQPKNLQKLHGACIESGNASKTRHLVFMFGASKLSMSNDILIPSASDFQDSISLNTTSAGDQDKAWEDKVSGIVWRGADSTNPHYQHFVSMMNATTVREAQMHPKTADRSLASALSKYPKYIKTSTEYIDLPTWLTFIANVGCTSIDGSTTSTFEPVSGMNASTQHSPYKFLPSFSSTPSFLAHLHSTSMPLVSSLHTHGFPPA